LAGGLAGALLLRLVTRVKGLVNLDRARLYWDARFVGKVFDYGYGLALWLFFSHLIMAADRFVLTGYLGYHDSGSYAAIKDLISKVVIFTTLPIYLSYQSKIADRWHSHHKEEAWSIVKEAISFQVLVCILVFIVFMVIKTMIISRLLNIPEMEQWGIYLPLLLGGFLWQTALLLQRFLELLYTPLYMLVAIGICALINILLNILLVPHFGITASSVIMLGTAMLYTGFLSLLFLSRRKNLLE
jgi:O-antigen/teichoic acid export membrane protein